MQYLITLLALVASTSATPFLFNLIPRQGITAAISPTASIPAGCSVTYSGSFGIAVQSITAGPAATAGVSQITDGQPQAASTAAPVSQISDGQPQAASVAPVTQISDGQIQATSKAVLAPVGQISDGQVQASTKVITMGMISMIHDGQIQAPVTHAAMTIVPVSQITDGQVQAPKSTVAPVSQIGDGQVQAASAAPVTQIGDGQVQAPSAVPVSQIGDGQPQAPKATAVSQIADGQPQAATAVTQISDGQPQASSAASSSSSSLMQLVACASSDTLSLTLSNGILLDSKGRTGYIASNYQFQFDKPAQEGAIYTAGFSVCSNGSLALGGSAVFYQCLSGTFYNLYDRNWAPQCSPVLIETLLLESC